MGAMRALYQKNAVISSANKKPGVCQASVFICSRLFWVWLVSEHLPRTNTSFHTLDTEANQSIQDCSRPAGVSEVLRRILVLDSAHREARLLWSPNSSKGSLFLACTISSWANQKTLYTSSISQARARILRRRCAITS